MDKELQARIEHAIDKAIADFHKDEESIFANENETLKYKYETLNPLRKWTKKQTCIVKGCNDKSIEKSHTIQKSGSIKWISESGHVLSPRFNTDNGHIEIVGVGINEASVFPGYCSVHERLFEGFENVKDIQSEEHLGLQLYRTVCREIVIADFYIDKLNTLNDKYKKFRNKKIGEAILDNFSADDLNKSDNQFKDFRITTKDRRLSLGENRIKNLHVDLDEFLFKFHDGILNDLSKNKFQKISYVALEFEKEIPVALAGRGNFTIKLKSKFKNVDAIINILPLEGKTFIFIATLRKFTNELYAYMSQFENPLQIISLIESWMIHGSDHWFMKPSIWEKIDVKFQKQILVTILDGRYNIGHEFSLTIFNELKMEFINQMEQNNEKLDENNLELLHKEKSKITFSNTHASVASSRPKKER